MKIIFLLTSVFICSVQPYSVNDITENAVSDNVVNNIEDSEKLANENEEGRWCASCYGPANRGVHSSRKSGPTSLAEGSVCDPNHPNGDCQCYGKWHKCDCPSSAKIWIQKNLLKQDVDEKCRCKQGLQFTCFAKQKCENAHEWGFDWRNEEERNNC